MKEPKFNFHRRTAGLLGIAFLGAWTVGAIGAYFYTDNISPLSVMLLRALFVVLMVLVIGMYMHARRADRAERKGWEERNALIEEEHEDGTVFDEPAPPPKEKVYNWPARGVRGTDQQSQAPGSVFNDVGRHSMGFTSLADEEARRRRQRAADDEEDERRRRLRDDETARQNQVNLTNAVLFSSLVSYEPSRACAPDPAPAPPVEYLSSGYERCDAPPAPPAPAYDPPSPPPPSYDPPASSPSYDSPAPSPSSDW